MDATGGRTEARESVRIIGAVLAADALPAGLIVGAGVAALTTLTIGLVGVVEAGWLLFIGAAWLAIAFHRPASYVGLCVTLFVCYQVVGRSLAAGAPEYCDVGFCSVEDPSLALPGSLILCSLGYGTGVLLRAIRPAMSSSTAGRYGHTAAEWREHYDQYTEIRANQRPEVARSGATAPVAAFRRLTLAASWLAIAVLASTVVANQPVPAPQTFSFELGPDWEVRSDRHESGQDCSAYWAALESVPPGTATHEDPVILCLGIHEAGSDFTDDGPGETCFESHEKDPWQDWWDATSVADPAIPGSVEKIMEMWNSDSMYGVAVGRQRRVGPVSENLCYWITVRLPSGSSVTESTVHAALATFRIK